MTDPAVKSAIGQCFVDEQLIEGQIDEWVKTQRHKVMYRDSRLSERLPIPFREGAG